MDMKGIFICFTGIDGAGKTTLAKLLVEDLQGKSIKATYVYNRYVPIILRPIMFIGRSLFIRNKDFYEDYGAYSNGKKTASEKHTLLANLYQLILWFDYFVQIFFKINLPLFFGKNVICDRYIYDTIVTDLSVDFSYSGGDIRNSLRRISSLFPTPDITFLVDLPEEIAFERKDDIPSIDYLKDRRSKYLHLKDVFEIHLLNGADTIESIRKNVLNIVQSKLNIR